MDIVVRRTRVIGTISVTAALRAFYQPVSVASAASRRLDLFYAGKLNFFIGRPSVSS